VARLAKVYFNGELAGWLKEMDQESDSSANGNLPGRFSFQYEPDYLQSGIPLSINLPLQETEFFSKELFPFFDNLISEGWLRQLQSTNQKISSADRMGLLLANGLDLCGAVCVEDVNSL
jgi:serine/threonine-protein kinase HipA